MLLEMTKFRRNCHKRVSHTHKTARLRVLSLLVCSLLVAVVG